MKHTLVLCGIAVLLFLAACGKQFDDPNIKDQYYVYLEDEQTGQPVSDQVLFTFYKNGTALCGYAPLNAQDTCGVGSDTATQKCHEEACYKMVEGAFYTQMEALKAALEAEAAAAANASATPPAGAAPAENQSG